MKACFRWDGNCLIPASEADAEECKTLQRGEVMVEIKRERNPQFHKLAFALINAMFESQEAYEDREIFRRQLKKLTGSYDEFIDKDGTLWFVPQSWEFAKMDDIEFHEIYGKLLSIAAKRFGDDFAGRFA